MADFLPTFTHYFDVILNVEPYLTTHVLTAQVLPDVCSFFGFCCAMFDKRGEMT